MGAGDGVASIPEFLEAVRALDAARARSPGDDLISALVCGRGEGAALAAERRPGRGRAQVTSEGTSNRSW